MLCGSINTAIANDCLNVWTTLQRLEILSHCKTCSVQLKTRDSFWQTIKQEAVYSAGRMGNCWHSSKNRRCVLKQLWCVYGVRVCRCNEYFQTNLFLERAWLICRWNKRRKASLFYISANVWRKDFQELSKLTGYRVIQWDKYSPRWKVHSELQLALIWCTVFMPCKHLSIWNFSS